MQVTNDILYIGVNDHTVDLFEGQYTVPRGMSYNSYVIRDDKIAIMDTVDRNFTKEWLGNIAAALDGKKPDYLIIQHVEPDHSASIAGFMQVYPDTVLVADKKAHAMIDQFYGSDVAKNRLTVADGETLTLGRHALTFVFAPMVHWPEVMVTYDAADRVLFSADGFGKFGALDADEPWADEARRYYIGIVGKYGPQVQSLLKKAAALDIQTICPLHGPVLTENIGDYVNLYQMWSSYTAENDGICIAFTSVYGNTKQAVELLEAELRRRGCSRVTVHDLARCDMAEAVADAFRYGKLVLATTTYNGGLFPFMRQFVDHLTERNYQSRTVGLIENGTWAPLAAKLISGKLESCKNLNYLSNVVSIRSALSEANRTAISAMADELCGVGAEQ